MQSKVQGHCSELAQHLEKTTPSQFRETLLAIGMQITLSGKAIKMAFSASKLASYLDDGITVKDEDSAITIMIPMQIARRGQELRLIFAKSENLSPVRIDSKLVSLIAKAEAAYNSLMSGRAIARSEKPHLVRLARLKFLAPDIVTAILEGKQPPLLTARKVIRAAKIPLCWKEQRLFFGFER